MTYCELCDVPLDQCPHGQTAQVRVIGPRAREILVSPEGLAHLSGCPHKGSDFTSWGAIAGEAMWRRLGDGERIVTTSGAYVTAVGRCRDCVEYGPW